MNLTRTVFSLALVAAATAACSASDADPAPATQLTLSLVAETGSQDPGGLQIAHFVEQVGELSDGAIRVEPAFKTGSGESHYDQYVAQQVIDGTADLGLVPSGPGTTSASRASAR